MTRGSGLARVIATGPKSEIGRIGQSLALLVAQAGVLTRRAAAIETLGSATVLCTDKTGTLTENRMAVAQLWLASGETALFNPPAPLAAALRPLAGRQAWMWTVLGDARHADQLRQQQGSAPL